MIAHSLKGDVFGPAQNLHGATFVVDATFRRSELDPDGMVVDIGRAISTQRRCRPQLPQSRRGPGVCRQELHDGGIARTVFDRLVQALNAGKLGDHARGVQRCA